MKVLTIVLEEAANGQKKLSYYGSMQLQEALAFLLEGIKEQAVEKYKETLKEQKCGDNL